MRSPSLMAFFADLLGRASAPLSRREFLRASAATGAALLLSQGRARARGTKPRVIIIGAGFAGLACAYELRTAGIVATLLEARGRVGGRVRTVTHPGGLGIAEAGGEFIGGQHHVWGAYAQQFGLPLVPWLNPAVGSRLVVNGVTVSRNAAQALYDAMATVLARITADAARVDPVMPWQTPTAARLDATSLGDVLDTCDLSPLCRHLLDNHFSNENAVAPTQQSYLALLALVHGGGLDAYWTQTEALRCPAGNGQLAAHLAQRIGAQHIHMRHAVATIAHRPDGVRVTCHNGAVFSGDICVLAVPPSAWSTFTVDPGLPAALAPQTGPAIKHLAWYDVPTPISEPTVVAGPVDGALWPMIEGKHGGVGDVFFTAGPGAQQYRAYASSQRDALRVALNWDRSPAGKEQSTALPLQYVDWPAQKFTQCGYSFPAVGEVMRCGPLWHAGVGRVQFIGEHTHPAFVGYMEGALRSGALMAKKLAAQYTDVSTSPDLF